jgi:predicted TPR repeat methyltransferase
MVAMTEPLQTPFQQGLALHQRGRLAEARAFYEQALATEPAHFDALHLLGVIHLQAKQPERALALIDRALAVNPSMAAAHSNRGNALMDLGRLAEALQSYEQAIGLKPDFADAHFNRGVALKGLARPDEALDGYDRALALKPDYVAAHYNRGALLNDLKRHREAVESYDRAIGLEPREYNFYLSKSRALEALDEVGHAIETLRAGLAQIGDNEELNFALARLMPTSTPASAPSAYVLGLFDAYAETFEEHLLGRLGYRVHEYLVAALLQHAPPRALDILDIGCGTGLLGTLLAGRKRFLAGVDLSPKMIGKAQSKSVYDELHTTDIMAFLSASTQRFDAVLAADVLIYIGELAPLFHGVHKRLGESGLFAFSIERSDDQPFVLNRTGRFAHSRDYIRALARDIGFEILSSEDKILRQQKGVEVAGDILVLRRT